LQPGNEEDGLLWVGRFGQEGRDVGVVLVHAEADDTLAEFAQPLGQGPLDFVAYPLGGVDQQQNGRSL
jgi:hypothetical protein